jgi:hypothetical protein
MIALLVIRSCVLLAVMVLMLGRRSQESPNEWLDDNGKIRLLTNPLGRAVVHPAVCEPAKRNVKAPIGPSPNDGDRTMSVALLVSWSGREVKTPKGSECVEAWRDCERLQMLDSPNHRHPVLVVLLSACVKLFIELDMPWMLECSPHAR